MKYTLQCECGKVIPIRINDAGSSVPCPCGATVQVPSLGELRRSTPSAKAKPRGLKFVSAGLFVGAACMAIYTWLGSDGTAIEFELAVNCIAGVIGGGFLGYVAHRVSLGFEGFGEADDDQGIAPEADRKARFIASFISVLIVVVIVGLELSPSIRNVQTRLLGQSPMGLPAPVVAVIAQLVLFIPVPFFLLHGIRVSLWSQQQGYRTWGLLRTFANAFNASRAGRSISISATIMAVGLFYHLAIGLIWSWYANTHGL